MKILFLISGNRVPSSRFRILPYLRYVRSAGHKCTVASSFPQKYDYFPWLGFRPSQSLKRLVRFWHWLKASVLRYDVIFVERELFNDTTVDMERRFRQVAKRMVLDVDDAIFLNNPAKTEELARMSDLVITGNRLIDEQVALWNSNTVVIPSGVELARYPEKNWSERTNDVPILGWIGTTGNLEYFHVIAPALRSLAKRCRFEMRFIVPDIQPLKSIDLSGVRTRHVVWRASTEIDELRKIDVGVMPLFRDREWDKYKCPTKLIQYMAIGVPGVASPVGFTADVATHGVDTFLASSTKEWEAILYELLQNPNLCRQIGRAGRQTVAAKYCVEANWPIFLNVFTKVTRRT